MIILTDSREQLPLNFDAYPCQTKNGTLQSGDYSIQGFEERAAIERKSESDLLGSLTQGRKRFEAELARLRGYELRAVVCETSWHRLANGPYQSRMNKFSCMQSIIGLSVRYSIPFIMAESRQGTAYFIYHILRHYFEQRQDDLKLLLKQAGQPMPCGWGAEMDK